MQNTEKFSLSNRALDVHIFQSGRRADGPARDAKQPAIIFLPDLTGVVDSQLETARLLALHCALRDDIKAPVIFHHSFGLTGSGIPEESARAICRNVQGHYVKIDPFCPASRVVQLKEQLGTHLETNYYDWPLKPHPLKSPTHNMERGKDLDWYPLHVVGRVGAPAPGWGSV